MEEITKLEDEVNNILMWCPKCRSGVKFVVRETKAICVNCWDTIWRVIKWKDIWKKNI